MITFSFTVARPSVTVKADGALSSGITVLTGQSGSGKSTFIKWPLITWSYTELLTTSKVEACPNNFSV